MKFIIEWLVKSSANPEETSATVKGILLQYVGTLVSVLMIFNFNVSSELVIDWISKSTIILGAFLTLFGLGRKIYFLSKKQ